MTESPTSQPGQRPVGLLAGAGRVPFLVAEGVRADGRKLAVVGLRNCVDESLKDHADRFTLAGMTRLSTIIRLFRRWGVRQVVMVGGVPKGMMHSPTRLFQLFPDLQTAGVWYGKLRKDKRDNKVLLAVADELAHAGIEIISSVAYCAEHLADEGLMTRTRPSGEALADAEFGWEIARRSAELDIGQAIAIRERDIIAVEAVEGTDRMIERAGQLCRKGGWTLIKVARPDQDMRFDVPTVGPDTVEKLRSCGGRTLVVETGRTIIVDKPLTLARADECGVAVIGMKRIA